MMATDRKKIFVVQPLGPEFEAVYRLIRNAVTAVSSDVDVFRSDEIFPAGSIIEEIYDALETSDLIICDISGLNRNVMYELGYAHGVSKPVILISQKPDYVPFDVRTVRTLFYYDLDFNHVREFVPRLRDMVEEALANPSAFSTRPSAEPSVNSVFISYSHKDTEFLDRLMVHLRPLEKEGLIDLWVDTRLQAGDKWKAEIEDALNRSRVAILLITADFLASNFIVDNELPPLLANAESKGARIIPVILKPCRFTRDKHLSGFQTINDPSAPLATLPECEQERIYDKISALVERLLVR